MLFIKEFALANKAIRLASKILDDSLNLTISLGKIAWKI